MASLLTSFDSPVNALVQGASRGLGLEFARQLAADTRVEKVFATCRSPQRADALARLAGESRGKLEVLRLDLEDDASIAEAAATVRRRMARLHLLLNVSGILHDEVSGMHPEKKLQDLDPIHLQRAFAVNAIGPALVIKHFHRLFRHDDRAVIANLSARVGSIEDNGLGGWYGYRASKAAQNQFTRTAAIELRRKAPRTICVALHPGTVDTDLSKPFQRGVPEGKLFTRERAVHQLLDVIDGLDADDSGSFFAWDGARIPW